MRTAVSSVFGALVACGAPSEPARDVAPPPALSSSAPAPTASAAASATTASPSASASPSAPAATEEVARYAPLPSAELERLTAELRERRVFRHLLLGSMPSRARDTWALSKDAKELTLTCEGDRDGSNSEPSGPPDRFPWYVKASVSFVAADPPSTRAGETRYRRERLIGIATLAPECLGPYDEACPFPAMRSTCTEVGEELVMTCTPAKLSALGRNAKVEATRRDDGWEVRWKPSARRPIAGLSCEVTAPKGDPNGFAFYDFPDDTAKPMLFFSDRGPAVERLVRSGGLQYAGFREAVPTPLEAELPAYLLEPEP